MNAHYTRQNGIGHEKIRKGIKLSFDRPFTFIDAIVSSYKISHPCDVYVLLSLELHSRIISHNFDISFSLSFSFQFLWLSKKDRNLNWIIKKL